MHDTPSTLSYAGSGAATTVGVLTFNEWVALAGLALGVATFLLNFWYKRQHLKLAKHDYEQRRESDNAG